MNYDLDFKNILKILTDGKELSYQLSKSAFEIIMSGKATDAQISSFLTAIKMQNHNPTVIAAGAEILRDKCSQAWRRHHRSRLPLNRPKNIFLEDESPRRSCNC